ncbi:hypothetical protein EB796_024328 [Bugula neritina]|uniref:Uncharacterized protein n=1 Tax=Bugula neritina TaxID=10212 RepID=A0A7J7IUZ9_BUGNE|nr:hypothetical protein EB796_024328 [Bugula neritina]
MVIFIQLMAITMTLIEQVAKDQACPQDRAFNLINWFKEVITDGQQTTYWIKWLLSIGGLRTILKLPDHSDYCQPSNLSAEWSTEWSIDQITKNTAFIMSKMQMEQRQLADCQQVGQRAEDSCNEQKSLTVDGMAAFHNWYQMEC